MNPFLLVFFFCFSIFCISIKVIHYELNSLFRSLFRHFGANPNKTFFFASHKLRSIENTHFLIFKTIYFFVCPAEQPGDVKFFFIKFQNTIRAISISHFEHSISVNYISNANRYIVPYIVSSGSTEQKKNVVQCVRDKINGTCSLTYVKPKDLDNRKRGEQQQQQQKRYKSLCLSASLAFSHSHLVEIHNIVLTLWAHIHTNVTLL